MCRTKKTLANMQMFFNGRNDAIKFMENYSSMILKAKKQSAERTVLKKILTLWQMLQRVPIARAQIKLGNNSEMKWNQTACLSIVLIKRNYLKRI